MEFDGVPVGWSVRPIWSMFAREKNIGHPEETMLSVFREHGVVEKESLKNLNVTADNRNIYQLVDKGWLVVNRMKAWQGSVGISSYRGIVSGHYLCFRPVHEESSRYLNWLLRSSLYTTSYGRLSRGVRPGQAEIDNDQLRVLQVLLPPLREQRRIADFLDDEIGRLDRLVNLRLRLVELMTEKAEYGIRQHIAESLQGVGPDKDAGKIPLKRILTKVKRPPVPGGEAITAFRDGQVTARSRRRIEGFTEAWTESSTFQGINVGDVVIHGLDGFAGAIGTSESEGVCSPAYHVCVPSGGDDPYFIGRMLRILALSGYLSLFGGSARQRAVDFRNWGSFARAHVPVVKKSEQNEIGALLRQIQILEDAVTRYTSLIGERKQALITAAVTGQFDVTAARRVA